MEAWAADHRVDALVTTGDNVYERGEPERFAAQLDQPYRELRRTRPMWATLGNHDVKAGHGAEQLRHLGLPDLPYVKSLPGLQLLFLDANRAHREQASWLDARLSEPGPPLRAAVFHEPAWSCSRHDGSERVERHWVPVLEDHRVALVLTGHDHNYQRFLSPGGHLRGHRRRRPGAVPGGQLRRRHPAAVRRGGPPPLHRRGGPRRLAHRERGRHRRRRVRPGGHPPDVDLEPDRPAARALPHPPAAGQGRTSSSPRPPADRTAWMRRRSRAGPPSSDTSTRSRRPTTT